MNNKLFVYGILKRGYELDLADHGATFLGEAHIPGAILYGIGRNYHDGELDGGRGGGREYHGVGLGLDKDPNGVAHGELWDVTGLWDWLDGIEQNGFCYTRKIVPVCLPVKFEKEYREKYPNAVGIEMVSAWVYEYTYPGFNYANPIKSGRF